MRVVETSIERVLNDYKYNQEHLYLIHTTNSFNHHYESKLTYEEGYGWWFYDPVLKQIEYIKREKPNQNKIITIHALLDLENGQST